jgi:hypothetical protein
MREGAADEVDDTTVASQSGHIGPENSLPQVEHRAISGYDLTDRAGNECAGADGKSRSFFHLCR